MEINDVIWLDDIVAKIVTKHGIRTWEVEEVLERNPEFRKGPKGTRKGEDLYYALGQTKVGRYLFVVFIRKRGSKALILTAREMTDRERKASRRRKRHG
jgi:uncharacterized DUF497 family protein